MNIPMGPLHEDTLPTVTDTQRTNVSHVYYCVHGNHCMLARDTYKRMFSSTRRCRRHGEEVQDVTFTPMGRSWLDIYGPVEEEE